MRTTHTFIFVAATALGLIVALTDVLLVPDMVVGSIPVLLFVLQVSLGGVSRIKQPAWLTLAAAFGLWGVAAGFRTGPIGYLLCGIAFGTIGGAAGIEVERRRLAK